MNSDPGTSGILSPFSKIDGLYFNMDGEPDSSIIEFIRDVNKVIKKNGYECLEVEFESKEEYYEVMNYVDKFLDDDIRVFGVDRDAPIVLFEREPDMVAEHEIGEAEKELNSGD